jgi:hypothetical protein
MNTSINTRITKSSSKKNGGIIDSITNYESLVIFGGFAFIFMVTIIFTGVFQAGEVVRTNLLYNCIGAFMMSFAFIYIIFNTMGSQLIILGAPIDTGMVIYVAIILFIMFVFGN